MPEGQDWDAWRAGIIGLGDRSSRKSYYPELQRRLTELSRFRALLDQSGDAILVADATGAQVLDLNTTAAALLGRPAAELLGQPVAALLSPPPTPGEEMQHATLLGTAGHRPVEVTCRLAASGPDSFQLIVARDITERVAAQDRLAASEESLRAVLNNALDGILVHDAQGQVIAANHTAFAMFGVAREQPGDLTMADLLAPVEPGLADRPALWARVLDGESVVVSWTSRRVADGTLFPTEVSLRRSVWYGREVIVAVVRDVTERQQAEAERRRLEARLQQAQKLESLGVLAGGIAHDFNNLLTAIVGNIELAGGALPADSPALADLAVAQQAANRAAELCRQMLTYAGRVPEEVRSLDLAEVVAELTEMIRVSLSKDADLQVALAPDLPPVLGDASQLRQVLLNLVLNASDALGDQPGQVRVGIDRVAATATDLHSPYSFADAPPGDYLRIRVSDTGCGMSAATLQRIFDPFFTTKFTGRGLGLAAVLGIVRGHRGVVQVDSALGQGTEFRVWLPVAGPTPVAPRPTATTACWRGLGRILVADDEPAVRRIAQRLLEQLGFDVAVAVDGQDCLAQLLTAEAGLTGLMLDLTMPNTGGDEVLRVVRATRPDLPVVLCSGHTDCPVDRDLLAAGPTRFLAKPFQRDELANVWRALLKLEAQPSSPGPPAG